MRRSHFPRVLTALLLLSLGSVALVSCMSTPPPLGLTAGRLLPCATQPNCVCSHDPAAASFIVPIACPGPDSATAALAQLKAVVLSRPRLRLLEERPGYLRFEATSALFRFKDDLEFLADDSAKLIHVRSASRVGHSDLGVNRRRVEAIREQFMATVPIERP